ncbi:hypothetical protein Dsin_012061 [Dipteronia sinensis]|uniref:Uncharacterized protein n=1 Tax=Dipteronia sinensis TaxID=43782 RepID=A0AAE0E7N8_9ROSI|nr:hypothetical protein Dsin_012061 [Dipteronia sinensis]
MKKNPARTLESSPYHEGCWMVLIDAAKGFATQPPDLFNYPADLVVAIFYKETLFWTSTGSFVYSFNIHRDLCYALCLYRLKPVSHGTVAASIADIDFVRRRQGIEELFEDGSASFLSKS